MSIVKSIKEYQIKIVGKITGVDIPINHRYVVTEATVRGNETDDGYDLCLKVFTFKDDTHSVALLNDLIEDNKIIIDLGATKPTKTIATLVKNNLESWFDSKAGIAEANWTEIS